MARAKPAKDGFEYYEHGDGDFYRIPSGGAGLWETALDLDETDWKVIHVPLSDQDWDHLYPMDPAEVEAVRGEAEAEPGERWEYFRHRDGDVYRAELGEVGWQINVWGEWKTMDVPLSAQDHDHMYPISEAEAERRIAADVEALARREQEEAEARQGQLFSPAETDPPPTPPLSVAALEGLMQEGFSVCGFAIGQAREREKAERVREARERDRRELRAH